MATIRIDEVNIPQSFDPEKFIREYFRPMRISKERKEIREEAARDFRDFLLFILALIATESAYNVLNWAYIEEQFRREMEQRALEYARRSQALEDYIAEKASDFISVTRDKDLSDPYWTSDERATMEAVNEANDVVGYEELQQAIEDGYTHKIWKTENDSRVRKTHRAVEGKKIPIRDMFEVGDGLMRYPHDWYYNPKECYNCRCALNYSKGNDSSEEYEQEESRKQEKALDKDTRVSKDAIDYSLIQSRLGVLGEDTDTTRHLADRAYEILKHRDGTRFEDLAYIDPIRHRSRINKNYDFYDPVNRISQCKPNTPMNRMLNAANKEQPHRIIGIHNHPLSGVPSYADIKLAKIRKYKYGLVVGHNGAIFKYSVSDNADIYKASKISIKNRLADFGKGFYNNDEALMKEAIEELKKYGVTVEALP